MGDTTKFCKHPDGCDESAVSKGWCTRHYHHVVRHGHPGPAERQQAAPYAEGATCKHPDGCDRPVQSLGWCTMHYKRVWKTGDPGPLGPYIDPDAKCQHPDGCDGRGNHGGWCQLHANRIRKTGDPGPVGRLNRKNAGQTCRHPEGCPKPAYTGGWCVTHYARLKNGLPLGPVESLRPSYPSVIPLTEIATIRESLLAEQGGKCAMSHCEASVDDESVAWQLDHDHSCQNHPVKRMCRECVRGVLCSYCNMSLLGPIEAAGDPVKITKSVLAYLEASATQLRLDK